MMSSLVPTLPQDTSYLPIINESFGKQEIYETWFPVILFLTLNNSISEGTELQVFTTNAACPAWIPQQLGKTDSASVFPKSVGV